MTPSSETPSDRVREKWREHAIEEFLSRKAYQDMTEYHEMERYSRAFQKAIRLMMMGIDAPDVVWRDPVIGTSQHH